MSEEQNNKKVLPEEFEKMKRQRPIALRIAQEAVKLANIPELPPNDDEFANQRWKIFYK